MAVDPNTGQTVLPFSQGLAGFLDPQAYGAASAGQANAHMLGGLGQAMMSQGYIPNSGFGGAIAQMVQALVGSQMLKRAQSDYASQQQAMIQAEKDAENAKHTRDESDKDAASRRAINQALGIHGGEAEIDIGNAPRKYAAETAGKVAEQTALMPGAVKQAGLEADARVPAAVRQAQATAGAGEQAKLAMIQKLMALPDSPEKTAQLSALLGEGGMQALAFGSMTQGGNSGGQGLTGEEYLKTLNPSIASQVKAIAEGRQAPPSAMALRSPMGQALSAAVSQYDPTFDATNFQARSKARNAFTSGNEGKAINAMNTAIGHAGTLLDAADALNNTRFPMLNSMLNAGAQATGDPRVDKFNVARNALAGELTKAFRGSSGSEKDIEEVQKAMNSAGSQDQMKAAIGQAMALLASKKESLADQYSKAFGANSQPNFLDDHATAAIKKLQAAGINVGALGGDYGAAAQSSASPFSQDEIRAELARRAAAGQ